MTETLVRVVAPHFVAGFVMVDGRCTEAAPILRKMCLGKPAGPLRELFARRGWKASIVRAGEPEP
jgi:hypothetical protein